MTYVYIVHVHVHVHVHVAFITESWLDSTVYDGELIPNSNYCF